MLVEKLRYVVALCLDDVPAVLRRSQRTVCHDELYVAVERGILFLGFVERLAEFRVAAVVFVAPLLVADTYVFKLERFRMSHRGADRTPLRILAAAAEFDEVERVLYVLLEDVAVYARRLNAVRTGLPLAGHAAVHDRNGRAVEILA